MNILVTGCNGQLGSEIRELEAEFPQFRFVFTDVHNLDLIDYKAVKSFIKNGKFDFIINCAAYTAVDAAETDVEMCDAINHRAVKTLAEEAKNNRIKLVHISTDYVFDGTKDTPYTEIDTPNPQGIYGLTKLKGEQTMKAINPENSIIIRTSWVYSGFGNNFVKTMLRLGKERDELNVVADQVGSPTYAGDLAKAILEILPKIKNDTVEIYHYANMDSCSWYEFARNIFKIKNIKIKVNPITTKQYPTAAKRPIYSVMDTTKIKNDFGVSIPHWKDSLIELMKHLINL
ncbi:MAG: dTDP-4-dehydrorhamnose reductase [Bacteroidia bacterium]|nr:dTDP-4-dehydrorhamnose reductase [Bacteroidia bacterium]